ncbi:hypothetical protein M758_10G117000 [Ceratodon purpureus]|nr:hypothetical protein M758_10G117000 [Ceratodon purpureus]
MRMEARGTRRLAVLYVLVFRPGLASASNDNSVRPMKAHLGTHLLRLGTSGSKSDLQCSINSRVLRERDSMIL